MDSGQGMRELEPSSLQGRAHRGGLGERAACALMALPAASLCLCPALSQDSLRGHPQACGLSPQGYPLSPKECHANGGTWGNLAGSEECILGQEFPQSTPSLRHLNILKPTAKGSVYYGKPE